MATPTDYISAAETGFASTTDMTVSSVVTWMWDNLAKPIIGSGLAVLYELRYVIIAFVVLPALIYIAYRGYRFFAH